MEEENPFKKKPAAAKPAAPAYEESYGDSSSSSSSSSSAAEADDTFSRKSVAAPEPAARRDVAYAEPTDPDENPFAKKRASVAAPKGGGVKRDDVVVDLDDGIAGEEAPPAKAAKPAEENPFAKRAAAAGGGDDDAGPFKGKFSWWEVFGFPGPRDRVEPPRGYKFQCKPPENPPPALQRWLAEERKRIALTTVFLTITPFVNWVILIYMLGSGDSTLYNRTLIVPRNTSVDAYTVLLNSFVTNPARWWNQVVDTVGFVALGYMLVQCIGPHRLQLVMIVYLILIPLCGLLCLGIELEPVAPVYGNQSILFGFLGVVFAYVAMVERDRVKHLVMSLVMTGVYIGIYIGVRFAVGREGDPVQFLTPIITVSTRKLSIEVLGA
jgi:hypothetical protein